MAKERVVFGEWLPDQPGVTGALTRAQNVRPLSTGYGPVNAAVDLSSDASQNLIGVFSGRISGDTTLFAAGATKLYKFDSATSALNDVSKLVMMSPTNYTPTEAWDFTQFGNSLIAANGKDKLQAWNLGSSNNFDDLSSDAPSAQFVTVVRDFVVAARDATNPNRVYWSDINNETNWTPGVASQSDIQDIPDGGDIQGLTGGEYGLILLERAIVRMSYIGSPLFFQFDTIARNLGCYIPSSIAQYGQIVYFLSDDGFYACDGQTVRPIGVERVDAYFYANVNLGSIDQMTAAIDPINKLVIWCFRNNSGNNELLIYNWQINRWSNAFTRSASVSTAASPTITLEGLDSYGTIDSLESSLDSRLWTGGKMLLAGTLGAKILTFTGPNLLGDIISGDINVGAPSIVKMGFPHIDNGSATVSIASRNRLDNPVVFSTPVAADDENRVPLRSVGRYHRVRVSPTGDNWNHTVGVDIELQPVGGR
jgi:hypothetical protein